MDTFMIIVIAIFSLSCAACAIVNGNNLYEARFGESLYSKKSEWITGLALSFAVCGLGAALFSYYDYDDLTIMEYIILMPVLLVIGRFDKKKMIIPNELIALLFIARSAFYIFEILSNKQQGISNMVYGVLGLLIAGIIFFAARMFKEKSIGMGDIKLFALLGYYVGAGRVMWMITICLFVTLIGCIVKLLRKKITMKDRFSLGPYISAGTILVLLLGI